MNSQTKIAELKTESTPSTVSPDTRVLANPDRTPESDDRLQAVHDIISEYQQEYPFIEAATVFGSTVHGGAGPESDVDAFVFINPDMLPEEFSTVEADGTRVLTKRDTSDMARAIQVDIMNQLGKQVIHGGAYEKCDVRVYEVSEELLAKRILDHAEKMKAYDREVALMKQQLEGLSGLEYVKQSGKRPPQPGCVDWSVAAIFHPGVGDKRRLNELRKLVIDNLLNLPEGQEIWEEIVSRVEMFEGKLHYNSPAELLPRTVEVAATVY